MRQLSSTSQKTVLDLAQQFGFSEEAVRNMLQAVAAGNGRMAQFSHPEFGGSGQWMRGGMTMVSDLFDTALKARIDALCDQLSRFIESEPELEPPAGTARRSPDWWPSDLGRPASTGAQNSMRYAYFADSRRLAIDNDGRITVYDTGDDRIGDVAQQQSGSASLTFTSQRGTVDVAELPIVSPSDVAATIESLAELHAKGILTEAEFSAKKAELLRRI